MRGWRKTGLPQTALLALLLALCLSGMKDAYGIALAGVDVQPAQEPGQVTLVATGMNMLRPNSLYVDGKRVEDCEVARVTYGECRATLNADVFAQAGDWYKLEVGFSKWGIFNLRSNPVWIEWQGL